MAGRTQKATRKFGGTTFNFANWVPNKQDADREKRRWATKTGANVRTVKVKPGYNVYVRT